MKRSFKVYGIKDGDEVYVDTAYSPDDGKRIHSQMKRDGEYDSILVRDALGGVVMRRELSA